MINYCHCFWCSNYSKFDQWALLQVSPFVLLTLVYLSSSTSLLSGYKTEFKPHDNPITEAHYPYVSGSVSMHIAPA